MAKLTKRDIQKTLEEMPIETLLSGTASGIKLTTKQKKFAKGVANGLTKAQAYREAYNTQGKPTTVASDAYQESKKPHIDLMIEAYKRANQMREYQLPEKTRSLLFSELVKHSLDEDFPPAQRVKCLELLGKLSDVGAFTEQKTTTVIHESSKLKQKLIDQLQTIVHGEVKEVTEDEGDLLLRELLGEGSEKPGDAAPTPPPPPDYTNDHPPEHQHINPHTQSSGNSEKDDVTVHVDSEGGVGGFSDFDGELDVEYREGPPMEKGTPESGEGV